MTAIVEFSMTTQKYASWYLWHEYTNLFFAFYPIVKVIGRVMDFFRIITPYTKSSVSWSGTNFHK